MGKESTKHDEEAREVSLSASTGGDVAASAAVDAAETAEAVLLREELEREREQRLEDVRWERRERLEAQRQVKRLELEMEEAHRRTERLELALWEARQEARQLREELEAERSKGF